MNFTCRTTLTQGYSSVQVRIAKGRSAADMKHSGLFKDTFMLENGLKSDDLWL